MKLGDPSTLPDHPSVHGLRDPSQGGSIYPTTPFLSCPVYAKTYVKTEMIFMSVAVWRGHLFSCGWPAKHEHKGFPRTNHVVVLVNFIVNYSLLWRAVPNISHEVTVTL